MSEGTLPGTSEPVSPARPGAQSHHRCGSCHRVRMGDASTCGTASCSARARSGSPPDSTATSTAARPTWPRSPTRATASDGPSRFMRALRFAAREADHRRHRTRVEARTPVVGSCTRSCSATSRCGATTTDGGTRSGPGRSVGQHAARRPSSPADEGERLPRAGHVGVGDVRIGQRRHDHRQVVARLRASPPTSSCWPPTCPASPEPPTVQRPRRRRPRHARRSTHAAPSRRAAAASSAVRRPWPWCSPPSPAAPTPTCSAGP